MILFELLFLAALIYLLISSVFRKEDNKDNTKDTSQYSTTEDSNVIDNENINSSLIDQNEDSEFKNSKPQGNGTLVGGVALILFINFLAFCLGIMLVFLAWGKSASDPQILFASLFTTLIGLGQLLYVIPLVIWLRKAGKSTLVNGIIVGAVITALLNGVYYLAMLK